jgi:hypothetical protein
MLEGSATNIALLGLIGAIVAAAPGLLGVLATWVKNRDDISRAMRNLELAKTEVEFISAWLEVSAGLDADESLEHRREQARTRLDRLMQVNEVEVERREVEKTARTEVGKTSHLGFYIYSGFFFAMLLGSGIDDQDEFSFEYFKQEMAGEGGVVILLFGIVWLVLFVKSFRSRRRLA